VPKTIHQVIIHHSHRLHEGVRNGRAHEFESSTQKISAQRVRIGSARRDLWEAFPKIDFGFASNEAPNVGIETSKLLLDEEEGLRVLDGGFDFQPVSNNAGVRQEFVDFSLVIAGDQTRVKIIEGAAIVLSFLEYGRPAQAGLRALQNQKLEQPAVIVKRETPFLIMISNVQV
jgi:hypothetical protein